MNDDHDHDPELTRRQALSSLGLAVVPLQTDFSSDATDGTLSALLSDTVGLFGFNQRSEAILVSSEQHPSVHVTYEEDSKESLKEWVDAEDDRALIAENDPTNTMTVAAPPSQLGLTGFAGLFSTGLPDQSYVESMDLNFAASLPEPVTSLDTDDVWQGITTAEGALIGLYGGSEPDTGGVAFDGAPDGTIRDARNATGAGDSESLWDSIDTSSITVAVIDTGCNTASGSVFSDETRVLDASKNMITGDTVVEEGLNAVADGNGHGSWVSSCIAANPSDDSYQGYLPNADILAIKALDDEGSGSTADIARGITYAADEGADVICMSLGSPLYSVELDRSLSYAAGAGAIPFAAVGNDRQGSRWVATPSDGQDVIAIAAGTVEDPADAKSAYFSNVGPDPGTADLSGGETTDREPHLAAPGMNLEAMVATESGATEMNRLSGTSMATPCVVGVAGLLLAADSSLDNDIEAVRDRLQNYATPVPNFAVVEAGAGYPNAQRAIDETEPNETQDEAMSGDAETRDDGYRALSSIHGSAWARHVV